MFYVTAMKFIHLEKATFLRNTKLFNYKHMFLHKPHPSLHPYCFLDFNYIWMPLFLSKRCYCEKNSSKTISKLFSTEKPLIKDRVEINNASFQNDDFHNMIVNDGEGSAKNEMPDRKLEEENRFECEGTDDEVESNAIDNICSKDNVTPVNSSHQTSSVPEEKLKLEPKPVKSLKKDNIKNVNTSIIQQFLVEKGIKYVEGHCCFLIFCPRLRNKSVAEVTSPDTMFINMITGYFVCQSCGKCGDWFDLVDNISIFVNLKKKTSVECFNEIESVKNLCSSNQLIDEIIAETVSLDSLQSETQHLILSDFKMESLSVSTLVSYCVRYCEKSHSVIFPFYNSENKVVSIKRITCSKTEENGEMKNKLEESVIPPTQSLGLFGWNLIAKQKDIVLTSCEKDALSVKEKTRMTALTLPKGYSVLPQEVLPSLERFQKIILWFGGDINGWEAAKQFSKKLNHKRCYIIRPSLESPRPYQAITENLSVTLILSRSKQIHNKSITTFSELRSEVYMEVAQIERVSGIKWKRYKNLNQILKGHRRGELTVFTGSTGSGKTTFISDYSLDLAMQGVNTLWGSFEINNARLLKMMLTQFAQKNLSKNLGEFDEWAQKFEELPLYLMTFHGQQSIKAVLDTMSHAVYVHDIFHVIVDNLQFMMGMGETSADKFVQQDKIVAGFRKFATQKNCHVTLVIHPRKEKENEDLTTSSVFGSAKATQEADNIMILQDKRLTTLSGRKYIQITKNRYDGDLGVIPLKYDKDSMSYVVKDKSTKKSSSEMETE